MLELTKPMPLPALPTITTRVATMDDLPFIDRLQKQHSKQLGFFPRAQIEGYVRNGWMRVAEEGASEGEGASEEMRGKRKEGAESSALCTRNSSLATPVGYVAFRDRYHKRDELGAVFQLCVDPTRQRGLIGATLLQSAFDASAYGCRLFCCWCAQDLAANRFWEAMGFQAIAYRTGSTAKDRVHLFWQKRIRRGDTATPWWFPSSTDGGAIREGRIVLPILPGTHWSEVRAMESATPRALPAPRVKKPKTVPIVRPAAATRGGLWFAPVQTTPAVVEAKPKREKTKPDPQLIAASRELRDRWLEQVNAAATATATASVGKYDVARQIEGEVVDGEVVGREIIEGEVVTTKRLAA